MPVFFPPTYLSAGYEFSGGKSFPSEFEFSILLSFFYFLIEAELMYNTI